MKKELIKAELDRIAKENDGLLRPEDVVAFAKNKKTALHQCFNWNDTEAAHQYRLWQAREVIQVHVITLPHTQETYRAFVSLRGDRHDEGGYRATTEVLNDKELSRIMLDEALQDFENLKRKYSVLQAELQSIFAAIDKVKSRAKAKAVYHDISASRGTIGQNPAALHRITQNHATSGPAHL
jgi:hypothetical protein